MFAGRRRRSSTIRVMQLFHELKQQFPTVPDHVVSACIANHAHSSSPNKDTTIREFLEAAAALNQQQEPMGRSPPLSQESPPTLTRSSSHSDSEEATITNDEMNDSEIDITRNVGVAFSKQYESVSVYTSQSSTSKSNNKSTFYVKRPDKLDVGPTASRRGIRPSEKCKDVFSLLNSDNVSEKPPPSPVTHRRLAISRDSPEAARRLHSPKETASTPTQTTDTLLGNSGNSVNLSLNVNCSMDVVHSPTRRKSVLQVTPQQPWLQEPISPRSYTSVNLTLRPPSSEPQPPIDITSKNSSLTYSTSSFNSHKGLQSRLQITVGPGGGSVAATRTRPRSSYHPEENVQETVPYGRAVSLNDLATTNEPPVILKQQARIERLKIELRSEKAKLEVMKNEIIDLEENRIKPNEEKINAEVENQLRMEIKHLQYQCEQLALETEKSASGNPQSDFYHNIYTGQRGPLSTNPRIRRPEGRFDQPPSNPTFQDNEGPKWNCHLCTFLNHPDLDKCEQCEMPRILHGKSPSNPNINNIRQQPSTNYNLVPSYSLPNFRETNRAPMVINRPIGFVLDNNMRYVAQNVNNSGQYTRPR